MNWKGFAVVALALAVLGSVLVLPAQAAPPQPYNLYGLARASDGTTPLAQGTRITAFIDGVDYSNVSSVYTASGDYDVDTYGDWVTQIGQPNTPERKEGGSVGDEIMYVAGDMTTSGQVFTTKKFWTPGDVVLENIQLAAQQPALLKICKIITRPADAGTQYLYLYNPSASPVDLSQYWLQKDVLGSYGGPTHTLSGVVGSGALAYVNLNGALTLVTTGDNIRLTWDNPGGTGFAGSDIIVDRVEFNATAGGTMFWEPGNTIMTDAPAPALGEEIRRSLTCADTNSNAVDFTTGPETGRPGANNPPTITLFGPNGGEVWTGNTNHQITWDMDDVEDTTLNYVIGLSLDNGGDGWATLVFSGSGPDAGALESYVWTVNTVDTVLASIRICVFDSASLSACDQSTAPFEIDSTRPTLDNTNPTNGATGVDVNSDVILTFSEGMNRTATENAVSFSPVTAFSSSWDGASRTLTTNPTAPLLGNTLYTVTVACAAKDDSDTGNALASCPRTFSFTTAAGAAAPVVDLTAPDGGQVWSGSTVHDITWTMSDSDTPGNLMVDLHYSTDGGTSYPNTIVTGMSRAQGSNTYQWTTPCIDSTTVRVRVTASDGTSSPSDPSSANLAIDCTRPTVLGVSPTDAMTEVTLPQTIVITFSEPMVPLTTQNAVSIAPSVSGVGNAWSAGDTVLTITHNDFAMCASYTITVGTTAVDASSPGNTMAAPYSWSFSTICGPTVSLSAPAGGEVWTGNTPHDVVATATDADALVRVTVQINTDGSATWTTLDGPTFRNTGVALTISVTIPAVDSTIARIRVIAQDQSGINGSATSSPFTIDATAPSVSSSVPANGATNVGLTDPLTITFSEEMDPTTTEAAITLTPAAGALTVSWNPAHTVATVSHAGSLARGQSYTLAVQVSALDVSDPGNALSPAYSATFTATTVSPVTADAGPDRTGATGSSFTFDGGGSTGPITEYEWEFISPSGVSDFETGETATYAFNQAGTWTVVLNVTDAAGNWDTDEATVTITAPPQQDFLSAYWWVFLILILAVVFAIIFLLLGKRRKKEEEMPEAVPAEEVETMPPAAPAKAPPKVAPAKAAAPAAAAKAAPTTRECPSCGTIMDQTDTECFMCGAKV